MNWNPHDNREPVMMSNRKHVLYSSIKPLKSSSGQSRFTKSQTAISTTGQNNTSCRDRQECGIWSHTHTHSRCGTILLINNAVIKLFHAFISRRSQEALWQGSYPSHAAANRSSIQLNTHMYSEHCFLTPEHSSSPLPSC